MSAVNPAATVISIPHEEPCHRCRGPLYLSATMPHPNQHGLRKIVLCPACDAHDPASQALIAFIAIHGKFSDEHYDQLSNMIQQWLAAERPSGVDEAALDEDVDAWRAGLYDG